MSTISTARPTALPRPAANQTAPAGPTVDPIRIIKQHRLALGLALIIGIALGVAAYFILVRVAPSYRSTVVYQVLPPQQSAAQGDSTQVDREEFERFSATEARVIVSETVLRDCIKRDRQLLETNWIKDYMSGGQPDEAKAYRELKEIVSARPVGGTAYIEVGVSAARAIDASIIATAVHEAYFRDLGDRATRYTADRKKPLSDRKNELLLEISRLDASDVAKFRAGKIEGMREEVSGYYVQVQQTMPLVAENSQRLQQAKTEFTRLEAMSKAEGGVQYNDVQRDQAERAPLVGSLKERMAALEAEDRAKAMQGLGEEHYTRKQLRTQMDATREQLETARANELIKIFGSDLDSARRAVEQNEAVLKDLNATLDAAQTKRAEIAQTLLEVEKNREDRAKINLELGQVEKDLGEIEMMSKLRSSERIGRVIRRESPRTPETLAFPRATVMIPLGVILALGCTVVAIVLRELFDQRVRGPADVGLIPRLRLLGIVPEREEDPTNPPSVEMAFKDAPTGAVSEAYRHIRSPILKRMSLGNFKSLLVLSGSPGSGATSAVANLAMQSAATEQRVLMIDANFRRPNLHRVFKLGEGPGLGDLLSKKSTLDQAIQRTAFDNLSLLSAGTAASRGVPERLATDSFAQLLTEAATKFDFIIIDTAPALVAGDGVAMANRVDATLLVVKALSEKRGFIARIRDQLSDVRAEFLGVIVNAVKGTAGGYLKKNIKTAFDYQNDKAA